MDEELLQRFDEARVEYGEDWIRQSMSRSFKNMIGIFFARPEYIDIVLNTLKGKEVTIAFEMCTVLQDRLFVNVQMKKGKIK